MSCPPLLITCATPRPVINIASVTMIGWMRKAEISAPFNTPTPQATTSANKIARPTPRPKDTAATAEAMAITDPTDKSIPRVAITIVIPTATKHSS